MESASALTWSEPCAADCWSSEIEGCEPFDCSGSALAAGAPRTRLLAESASRYLLRRWLAPQPTKPSCPSEPAGFRVEADGDVSGHIAFRDGRIHIREGQCDTCVFLPGSLGVV